MPAPATPGATPHLASVSFAVVLDLTAALFCMSMPFSFCPYYANNETFAFLFPWPGMAFACLSHSFCLPLPPAYLFCVSCLSFFAAFDFVAWWRDKRENIALPFMTRAGDRAEGRTGGGGQGEEADSGQACVCVW